MLQELSIVNFAIIDDLRISFSEGLTILSGETGAGKSVIINAVNLLLGMRATAKLIRTGAEQAELEALFQIDPEGVIAETLNAQGYDASETLLIKRIIARNDRHRIYINGRLATTHLLSSATEHLAGISGQHAHQGLLKEEENLRILDQFGGLTALRKEVCECYHQIVPLIEKLDEQRTRRQRRAERIELLEFQKKEIVDTGFTPQEDSTLEKERAVLRNGEALFQAVHGSIREIYSAEGAIVERISSAKKMLDRAAAIDPDLSSRVERLSDAAFQLTDLADELRTYQDNIQIDERRLEAVEERLDTLNRLKRKYGGSLEAVSLELEAIDKELADVENLSGAIAETEAELSDLTGKIVACARKLSQKRHDVSRKLAKEVERELVTLQMTRTRFEVALTSDPSDERSNPYLTGDGKAIHETGFDRAVFLISPNVGEPLKPLASIASGGELSRVVLSLKAIMAATASVETVVFDEVDAGIGGGVAEGVGKKLSALARHHQVICITHLPQIAKFGDHHFRISKHVSKGRTRTAINRLDRNERIHELARMLGGAKITEATLAHAKEMIQTP
jgi:DNA repair protein RecN (Recombination protein N)